MDTEGGVCEREGWRLTCSPDAGRVWGQMREKMVSLIVASAAGKGNPPYRRSRHATTYLVWTEGEQGHQGLQAFVKVYDPPPGPTALKRVLRGSPAAYAARVSAALLARGFAVPRAILCGEEPSTGRAMLVTERAEGASLASFLGEQRGAAVDLKRRILRALGAEVARLHRAGYIHGDLTPHNVFLVDSAPPHFVFIDHDRTRRAFAIGRRRRQLRNLVQLLRFDLPRLTGTDRMRVFHAWAAPLELQGRNTVMHRAFKMLKLRIARDVGKARTLEDGPDAADSSARIVRTEPAADRRASRAG